MERLLYDTQQYRYPKKKIKTMTEAADSLFVLSVRLTMLNRAEGWVEAQPCYFYSENLTFYLFVKINDIL
jgi:hypothetical protein